MVLGLSWCQFGSLRSPLGSHGDVLRAWDAAKLVFYDVLRAWDMEKLVFHEVLRALAGRPGAEGIRPGGGK